eukprot:TRINITY_DN5820_c0_g1_i2.p1 TRINITY_DN5820_c0_g1~~TRINITY_DN5820_c0_g1_i2.p1  ORF type:complete len:611 (-),score=45.98 TRINITY_DN5820_c0_g1_i2:166-1758(-)
MRKILRINHSDNSDEELVTIRTKELMEERHAQMVHQYLLYSSPFLVLAATPLLFQAIRNSETGYKDHVPRYANTSWFEGVIAVYSLACALWEQFPSKRARILVTLLFYAKLILSTFAYTTCLQFIVDRGQLSYVRLLVTLFPGDAELSCVCQALSSLVLCLQYNAVSDETSGALFGDDHVQLFILSEWGGTVMISAVGFMLQSRLYREAKATAAADNSDSVSWAWKNVLSSICDVVLELDDEMRIIDSAQSLALMLMRHCSRSLQGSQMKDFLTDENDFDKFQRFACGSKASSSDGFLPVVPFHTRLKDRLGNNIDVEIFQCPFRNKLTNKDRYIVGVREFSDISPSDRLPRIAADANIPEAGFSEGEQGVSDHVCVPTRLGRGTPVQSKKETLDSASSSSCMSSEAQNQRLAVPGALESHVVMMQHVLLGAMASWNLKLPRVHCCLFHAYLQAARNTLKSLQRQKCRKWTPHSNWQCSRCKMMNESAATACFDDGVCILCCDVSKVDDTKVRSKRRNDASHERLSKLSL